MECSICTFKLIDPDNACSSMMCGHIYHTSCLQSWRNKGNNTCPQCRKPSSSIINLFLPIDNERKAIDNITKNVSTMTTSFVEVKSQLDMMMGFIQNSALMLNDLKKDNDDIKKKVSEIEIGSMIGSSSDEQLQAKNLLIQNMRKEITDLKLQRSEQAKQMQEIQQQVAALKINAVKDARVPLQNRNAAEPKAITLSLKFDDINDKMIVND